MNTQDLKIFEAVAVQGNFTKAAEAMFTVQSNVTARIKLLEEEFGAELFLRSTRKVELTPAGNTLMLYCKKINHLINEAKNEVANATKIAGDLKIGCIETTMVLKVPEIILQFGNDYPEVNLEFRSAMRGELINDVLNYKLDAAFVPGPIYQPELQQKMISEEQLVIISSMKYKKLEDMVKENPVKIVVFDQGCIFRARIESWLVSKGVTEYRAIVLNSMEAIINFVEAGLGISILPLEIINHYYANRQIKTFALNKELGTMNMLLLVRKDIPASPSLKAFMELY